MQNIVKVRLLPRKRVRSKYFEKKIDLNMHNFLTLVMSSVFFTF